MSHRRLGLFLLVGSLLLVTPFMVGFSRGVEKSIFSAMATLTDVKETLEAKRDLLTEIYAESRYLEGERREERLGVARKHYEYAADVHRLAGSFLEASARRHPKYQSFWVRSEKTLGSLWEEIEEIRGKLLEAPRPSPPLARLEDPPPATGPTESEPVQEPDRKRQLLDRYREAYQRFAKGSQDDLAACKGLFEDILKEEPNFHLARYWLARTYLLQDQVDLAKAQAERLLRDQPNLQIARDLVRDVADIRSLKRGAAVPARVAMRPPPAAAAPSRAAVPLDGAPPTRTAAVLPAPPPPAAPAAPALRPSPPAPAAPAAAPPKPVHEAPRALARAPAPPEARPATAPRPAATRPSPRRSRPATDAVPGELKLAALDPIRVPPARAGGEHPRPMAVMIENSKHARPQSGLLGADFVYEMPVEGGITRFMAVFLDPTRKVDELGPVRSARHYFVHQVPVMDAIYAHCGGSTMGYAALKKEGVDHIDEIKNGWGFWRNRKRSAPHNLYTKLANVVEGAERLGFRLATKATGGLLPVAAAPHRTRVDSYLEIEIPYYSHYKVSYTYDPVTGTYARFINGEPHEDRLEGRQIAVDNVVLVKIPMHKIDDYGRLDLELFGHGEAQVHRGGEMIPGQWVRAGKDAPLSVRDSKGRPVEMNPGRTWIHVVQPNRQIALSRRPLPPQVLARLEEPSRKAARPAPEAAGPLPGALGVSLQLARASGKGVPGVIATPVAEPEPTSGRGVGIPGTVVLAAAPTAAAPAPPSLENRAETRSETRAETRSADHRAVIPAPPPVAHRTAAPQVAVRSAELPPALAQPPASPAARPEPAITAASVPEALRPLPPRPPSTIDAEPEAAEHASRVWRNGTGVEYDLADFSLDSF